MVKNFPSSISVYETPIYFAVDWLNEYWMQGTEDDYRFVYIGPKGSWYKESAKAFVLIIIKLKLPLGLLFMLMFMVHLAGQPI